MGNKQVNFRIDENIARKIKIIAFKKEIPQSELVRQYINEGLKRETTQATLDDIKI